MESSQRDLPSPEMIADASDQTIEQQASAGAAAEVGRYADMKATNTNDDA